MGFSVVGSFTTKTLNEAKMDQRSPFLVKLFKNVDAKTGLGQLTASTITVYVQTLHQFPDHAETEPLGLIQAKRQKPMKPQRWPIQQMACRIVFLQAK